MGRNYDYSVASSQGQARSRLIVSRVRSTAQGPILAVMLTVTAIGVDPGAAHQGDVTRGDRGRARGRRTGGVTARTTVLHKVGGVGGRHIGARHDAVLGPQHRVAPAERMEGGLHLPRASPALETLRVQSRQARPPRAKRSCSSSTVTVPCSRSISRMWRRRSAGIDARLRIGAGVLRLASAI